LTREAIGLATDPCPTTKQPHEWEWMGTQTEQCKHCKGVVWFRGACLDAADLISGLPYVRHVYRVPQPGDIEMVRCVACGNFSNGQSCPFCGAGNERLVRT
jgi:predicted RNA-binding Zn-ribbon protein involved in translation (DUF1610 family)